MKKGKIFRMDIVDLDMLDYLIDLKTGFGTQKWHRNLGLLRNSHKYMGHNTWNTTYKTRYCTTQFLPTKDGLLPDHINHNGLDIENKSKTSTNAENIKNRQKKQNH